MGKGVRLKVKSEYNDKELGRYVGTGETITVQSPERAWKLSSVAEVVYIPKGIKEPRRTLSKGLSFLIRAKNEEENVEKCLLSIVGIADEIIFVDNGSEDKTLELAKKLAKKHKNIKVYEYLIKIPKCGDEQKEMVKSGDGNTIGTYYNFCLGKATKYNVIKWDADFIATKELKNMITKHKLNTRKDKFSLWFTGETVFVNEKGECFKKKENNYDEYRCFSQLHGFKWKDNENWEYPDTAYLESAEKEIFQKPVFYEMKRVYKNEFEGRTDNKPLDLRDVTDAEIMGRLSQGLDDVRVAPFGGLDRFLKKKPSVCLVVDTEGWAYSNIANQVITNLNDKYSFKYVVAEDCQGFEGLKEAVTGHDLVHFFRRTDLLRDPRLDWVRETPWWEGLNVSTAVYDHLLLEYGAHLLKLLFENIENYYVCSNKLRDIYSDIEDISEPSGVIQDGVDLTKFYPQDIGRFLNNKTLVVGWVGNSEFYKGKGIGGVEGGDVKGVEMILKPAIEELKEKHDIELVMADRKEGMIPHDKMKDYYAKIDLYVCVSEAEGTPNPVLEAMACGVPVISTDVGIVKEAFGVKQKEMILKERSVECLKEKIVEVIESPDLLRELSQENLTSVDKWSWKVRAKNFDLFFKKCLQKEQKT